MLWTPLPAQTALAGLFGKYVGEIVVTFDDEGGEAGGFDQELLSHIRRARKEGVERICAHLRISPSAKELLGRVFEAVDKAPNGREGVTLAREFGTRMISELKGTLGHEPSVAFIASYSLREIVKIAALIPALPERQGLSVVKQPRIRNLFDQSLQLIGACLNGNRPGSEPHLYISEVLGNLEAVLADWRALTDLCRYLSGELVDWFAEWIEWYVPDTQPREELATFWEFGYAGSCVQHGCLMEPMMGLELIHGEFVRSVALARRLGVGFPAEIEAEAEQFAKLLTDRAMQKLRSKKKSPAVHGLSEEASRLSTLVRGYLRDAAATVIETEHGSAAHSAFTLGGSCGRVSTALSASMHGAPVLLYLVKYEPHQVSSTLDTLVRHIERMRFVAGIERWLLDGLESMRTADPMGLDVQRVWQVVTTEVRAAIDQLQQIKPTIPAHLRQVEANVSEFLRDHPMYAKNVFLIMRFQRSRQRAHIYRVIREEMEARGFKVFRADTKEYAEDLWANVCVYMLGCARAIAVFEQIETTDFYPNLALEVGFMFALGKPVLLLKDEKVDMPADLIGKLYRPFAANRLGTLRTELTKWMDEVAGPGLEITKRGSRRTAIAGSSRA